MPKPYSQEPKPYSQDLRDRVIDAVENLNAGSMIARAANGKWTRFSRRSSIGNFDTQTGTRTRCNSWRRTEPAN
jgi:hypothetical protein